MTEDRLPDGGTVPGGPSLYSARMARRLGVDVTLVTAVPEGYRQDVLADFRLVTVPAAAPCVYENRYDADGTRTQWLLDTGDPLPLGITGRALPADILLAAPAYHELAGLPQVDVRVHAAALQGPLRTHAADGQVSPHPDPLAQARRYFLPGLFAFLSEEDTPDADALARAGAAAGATVVVTRGGKGASVFAPDGESLVPASAASPVDPTGAGDCFAATFVVRFAETGDRAESLRWALAAGALATEASGIDGVPSRAAIEQRVHAVVA